MADGGTIGAILTGAGALGVAIRWSAGILAAAWNRMASVVEANTAMLTKVAELFGRVDVRVQEVGDRVEEMVDEVSGVHTAAKTTEHVERTTTVKAATPPKGTTYHFKRPQTERP